MPPLTSNKTEEAGLHYLAQATFKKSVGIKG